MIFRVIIFILIVAADQITKIAVRHHLATGEVYNVIPKLFNITLVYNPGAAFGMFGGMPDTWRRLMIGVVSFIALIVVCRFMMIEARHDKASRLALIAILAGAVGNIIDRARFDSVVDFLDFFWGRNHWPAFNVADSAISIGVCVLMLRMVLGHHDVDKQGEKATPAAATADGPGITG